MSVNVVEHADRGAAARQPVPGDDLGEPRLERLGEAHDAEGAAERAGDQHRRLGHADHREIEQLARAAESRIAERGADRGIEGAALLRQHLEQTALPIAASARVAM